MNTLRRQKLSFTVAFIAVFFYLCGQTSNVAINNDGSPPDASAILDIKSSSQGLLIPRLTTSQRNDIDDPKVGLEIYNLDINCFEYYNGTFWLTNCGFFNDPTMAMAGTDRVTTKDTVHLDANSPKSGENGQWSILEGVGGAFSDITDSSAIFNSNGNFDTYLLRWTISNPCGKSYSDVQITFNREGIYVSFNGSDSNGNGSPSLPYKTIQKGIDEALSQSLSDIFISEGFYLEFLSIDGISGINLKGGHYAFDWNVRDFNLHQTKIEGGEIGCSVSNSSDLTFSGLVINNQRSFSGNSIGIDIENSTNILVDNCYVTTESAANGINGEDGTAGNKGNDGEDYKVPVPCNNPNVNFGGLGGQGGFLNDGGIPLNGGIGGNGGGGTAVNGSGNNGSGGASGSGGGGGAGGNGIGPCTLGNCATGGLVFDGFNGADGADGVNGLGGVGGVFPTNGQDGTNSQGGGGGGGGGGCGLSTGTSCGSRVGNSGAGGGGGGSGATAGKGGEAGYSSIGIWVKNSSVTVTSTQVKTGYGGNGGNSGMGGNGGIGGDGGFAQFDDFSISGKGGKGGKGGEAGSGGGGGGGSSACVAYDSASTLTQSANSYSPGPFGLGGQSAGLSGQNGTSQDLVSY